MNQTPIPLEVRAKLLMALLALVVLGIGLIVVVILSGWAARRMARQGRTKSRMINASWRARPSEPPVAPPDTTPPHQDGPPHETGRIDETGQ